mgnify:CR=1 FL=1
MKAFSNAILQQPVLKINFVAKTRIDDVYPWVGIDQIFANMQISIVFIKSLVIAPAGKNNNLPFRIKGKTDKCIVRFNGIKRHQ